MFTYSGLASGSIRRASLVDLTLASKRRPAPRPMELRAALQPNLLLNAKARDTQRTSPTPYRWRGAAYADAVGGNDRTRSTGSAETIAANWPRSGRRLNATDRAGAGGYGRRRFGLTPLLPQIWPQRLQGPSIDADDGTSSCRQSKTALGTDSSALDALSQGAAGRSCQPPGPLQP